MIQIYSRLELLRSFLRRDDRYYVDQNINSFYQKFSPQAGGRSYPVLRCIFLRGDDLAVVTTSAFPFISIGIKLAENKAAPGVLVSGLLTGNLSLYEFPTTINFNFQSLVVALIFLTLLL